MVVKPHKMARRGMAYVMAMIVLSLFLTLAGTFAAMTDVSGQVGKNAADLQRAGLAAESGLAFGAKVIRGVRLPSGTGPDQMIQRLSQAVAERLDGTANLNGGYVTSSASVVSVPRIQIPDGSFDLRIVQSAEETLTLEARGFGRVARQSVAVDLTIVTHPANSAFSYGIASLGPIVLSGNAEIRGKNALTDASIVSTTDGTAVSINGNAVIDGDISSAGPESTVVISGTPTIAGSQDPEVIAQHVHFGVAPPVFPTVDTSIFKPLATTIIDSGTDTGQKGAVFNNPIIKAGTNPTFSSDVTLNGVVYIEAPNIVTFSSKVTLNGLVATDDSDEPISACKISFSGQVEAYGVEALPDATEFQPVKALTGTFIVAPGFDVSFAGQFTTINGTIAASKLSFSGQAEGTVEGSVLGLGGEAVSIDGNVSICIDREDDGDGTQDAGFVLPILLDVDSRTYREIEPAGE